jgi:hypothetical protein
MDYQYRPSLVCGKPGVERCFEKLPDGAVLIKVFHNDREFCAFPEYKSAKSVQVTTLLSFFKYKPDSIINYSCISEQV